MCGTSSREVLGPRKANVEPSRTTVQARWYKLVATNPVATLSRTQTLITRKPADSLRKFPLDHHLRTVE